MRGGDGPQVLLVYETAQVGFVWGRQFRTAAKKLIPWSILKQCGLAKRTLSAMSSLDLNPAPAASE